MSRIRETGFSRVNLYAQSLRTNLEQFRHLPYVLARDRNIHGLLNLEFDAIRVNPHLEDFAIISSTMIFILDRGGTTVATSNWRSNRDLSGYNFSYRPYFKAARNGLSGGYYAVGSRTGEPGFFISYPVLEEGRFLGAVVVKVNLETIQQLWIKSGEDVIVSDAYGILFLSSNPDWKYKSLRPLPPHTAKRLQEVQYQGFPLATLKMERQSTAGGNILILEGKRYLEQSLQLPEYGWRIHYLTNLRGVKKNVHLARTITAVLAGFIMLTVLFFRERRHKLRSREEARKSRIIEKINERLLNEIEKHKQTEENLIRTQKELIQTGKLAALGRMSAAIAHELNQPVTAIRTFTASCRIFLQRNELRQVEENLDFITGLTERMASITGQLKIFARKNKSGSHVVDLTETIEKVLLFFAPQIKTGHVTVRSELVQKGRALVCGDSLHLEQVMNNLLNNSLHAMRNCTTKKIDLKLTISGNTVILTVTDSGTGIADEVMDSLFEPFFTTKDIGDGLGLGLSITYGIIQDMNGTISAGNFGNKGARFTIRLPLAGGRKTTPEPGQQP
jgi:two-component system C4-dicarboxylate transport sensor histidine kinase DctB